MNVTPELTESTLHHFITDRPFLTWDLIFISFVNQKSHITPETVPSKCQFFRIFKLKYKFLCVHQWDLLNTTEQLASIRWEYNYSSKTVRSICRISQELRLGLLKINKRTFTEWLKSNFMIPFSIRIVSVLVVFLFFFLFTNISTLVYYLILWSIFVEEL